MAFRCKVETFLQTYSCITMTNKALQYWKELNIMLSDPSDRTKTNGALQYRRILKCVKYIRKNKLWLTMNIS